MRLLRYPEDDDASSIFDTEDLAVPRDLKALLLLQKLLSMKWHFDETSNPLYALNALVVCTEHRVYPPIWVLKWMADRIGFSKNNGHSLDRAFGFSRKGKGKWTPPRERADLRHRDQLLMSFVHKLEAAGLSRPEAAKALESLLARLPEGEGLTIEEITHLGLAFKKKGASQGLSEEWIIQIVSQMEGVYTTAKSTTLKEASAWTNDDRRFLLRPFYPAELPKSIVDELGLVASATLGHADKSRD